FDQSRKGMIPMNDHTEALRTFKDVQARLKTSERTLRRWIAEGQIETIHLGRQLRFEEREVKRFIDLRRRHAKKAS
ncbi:MAG TPA: helix-turn-helix domain-containing protein, partial [Ktedonobacteraceae bacterium]